jgi:hypothetical protein
VDWTGTALQPPYAAASCAGRFRGTGENRPSPDLCRRPRHGPHASRSTGRTRQQPRTAEKEETTTTRKQSYDKLSVFIPRNKLEGRQIERLIALGKKRDRSVNYLVIEAIFDYLKREETKN